MAFSIPLNLGHGFLKAVTASPKHIFWSLALHREILLSFHVNGELPYIFLPASCYTPEFKDCHCMLGQMGMKLNDLFAFPCRRGEGGEGGVCSGRLWKCRLIYHSSFISLVLVSGGVMFGTSKLCVLPKRCDAKRNRCCFNLEPDLSKHEYITCSIPHPPADALALYSCNVSVY